VDGPRTTRCYRVLAGRAQDDSGKLARVLGTCGNWGLLSGRLVRPHIAARGDRRVLHLTRVDRCRGRPSVDYLLKHRAETCLLGRRLQHGLELDAGFGSQCVIVSRARSPAAVTLLASNPRPTDSEINDASVRNVCRCGTYNRYSSCQKYASGGRGVNNAANHRHAHAASIGRRRSKSLSQSALKSVRPRDAGDRPGGCLGRPWSMADGSD